jgi:hypothetical protein
VSQEHVEKTYDFIAAYNRRDFDAAVQFFDPEIDWVLPEHQRFDSCKGPEEVRRFWDAVRLRYFMRGKAKRGGDRWRALPPGHHVSRLKHRASRVLHDLGGSAPSRVAWSCSGAVGQLVTAPSEADPTCFAYLPSTPFAYLGAGGS